MERRGTRIEYDVPLRRDLAAMQTEGFAQAALDAVADHCIAQSARDGEPDSRTNLGRRTIFTRPSSWRVFARPSSWRVFARLCFWRVFARLAEGCEQRTGDAESVIINVPEIGRA